VIDYGVTKKAQVGDMVRRILHLATIARPDDAADAAALLSVMPTRFVITLMRVITKKISSRLFAEQDSVH
jgi:Holliday junction resolvasome RuvABC endonuclease subunit